MQKVLPLLSFFLCLFFSSCIPALKSRDNPYDPAGTVPFTAGQTWTLATSTGCPARRNAALLVYQNRMWLIAGHYQGNKSNDVWHSSNGTNWMNKTVSAAFMKREGAAAVVFDNKMWIIGGETNSGYTNDVWNSSDGDTWTPVSYGAGFSPRATSAVVFQGKIWIIAGVTGANQTNDVWNSADGITWNRISAAAPFTPRKYHSLVVCDDKIWLLCGTSGVNQKNDIWSTSDGITWAQVAATDFLPREQHTCVAHNNRIMLTAGAVNPGAYTPTNDVWHTVNGTDWTRSSFAAQFGMRRLHCVVSFMNSVWLVGGYNQFSLEQSDVWYSR